MDSSRDWVVILAATLVLAACTHSGDPAAPASGSAPTPAPAAATPGAVQAPAVPDAVPATPAGPTAPGMRVFLDPQTGEARRPTRAEAAAGAAADRVQRESAAGQAGSEGGQREHFVLPDGTEGVKLGPHDRHSVTVCLQADGSFGSNCPPATGSAKP